MLPEASVLLKGEDSFKGSGGWIYSAADYLCQTKDVELFIAIGDRQVKKVTYLEGENIKYYVFPIRSNSTLKAHRDNRIISSLKTIKETIMPDVVHIHGTEHALGLAYITAVGKANVVVSIQGLISVIAKYYQTGISTRDRLFSLSIRDLLSNSSISSEQLFFRKRGANEIALLKKVDHIIGRTYFDKSHSWEINPNCSYHYCNETLREEFYNGIWSYAKCEKHSIFLSQVSYPIKGFHLFLKALPLVIREYPDTKVYIAGPDITRKNDFFIRRMLIPGYWRLLKRIIKKNHLEKYLIFTGLLDAEGMREYLLKANVFVSPSTIENSPNSLGEAQLLGVPCLASYVGGVPDFIPNSECGFMYRCEDVTQLSYGICSMFESSKHFCNNSMRELAAKRHDRVVNGERLLEIYRSIITSE